MEAEEGVITEVGGKTVETMKVAVKSAAQIDVMKCAQLKDELKIRGLCTTGNKSKLVERLKVAVLEEQARVENNIYEEEDDNVEEERDDNVEEEKDDNVEEEEDDNVEEDEKDVNEEGASIKLMHKNQTKKPSVRLSVRDVEDLLEKFSGNGYPSVQNWVRDFDELRLQDYGAMKKEAKAKLRKEDKPRQHGVKEQKRRVVMKVVQNGASIAATKITLA